MDSTVYVVQCVMTYKETGHLAEKRENVKEAKGHLKKDLHNASQSTWKSHRPNIPVPV